MSNESIKTEEPGEVKRTTIEDVREAIRVGEQWIREGEKYAFVQTLIDGIAMFAIANSHAAETRAEREEGLQEALDFAEGKPGAVDPAAPYVTGCADDPALGAVLEKEEARRRSEKAVIREAICKVIGHLGNASEWINGGDDGSARGVSAATWLAAHEIEKTIQPAIVRLFPSLKPDAPTPTDDSKDDFSF